jgi:SAM-dependent methyltransferase
MKKVDFDRYAGEYDELLREKVGFFSGDDGYFAAYKVELTRRKLHAAPKAVLEFGCGTGRNIAFLRKAFPAARIVATDVSQASLEVARKRAPEVELYQEPADGLGGEFDLIFVSGVFHHVAPAQRHAVAATLKARMSPGARMMVFEHNPFNPVTRAIVNSCPYDADAVLLYPRELKRTLWAQGMTVVDSGFTLFWPGWLSALRRLEAYMEWLPLGGQYYVLAGG